MSMRGAILRILDKHKSGEWDRDEAANQLEKYVQKKQAEARIDELERLKSEHDYYNAEILNKRLSALKTSRSSE